MSYGKLVGVAAGLLAATGIGYVFGGEKFKKKEERNDYKDGLNHGKSESINNIKEANDKIGRASCRERVCLYV